MSFNNFSVLVTFFLFGLVSTGQTANVFSSKGRGTRGPTILSLDPSARNAGVAGAFAATATDGEALFGNPAGLQQLAHSELRVAGGGVMNDQSQTLMSYVHPHWRRGERETWGAFLQSLSMKSFDVYEEGQSIGAAHPQDWVAAVSYARPTPLGNGGLTFKGVSTETFESKAKSFAMDVGLQGGGTRWGWGASLVNLGPSFHLGTESVGLPTRLRTGITRQWVTSWGHLCTALLGDFPADNDPAAGFGVELETPWGNDWGTALRAGARTSGDPFAFGAGVTRGTLSIEYAFTPTVEEGSIGQMNVVYRFGHAPPQETRRRELMGEARSLIDHGDFGQAQSVLDEVFVLSPRYHRARAMQQELRLRISETLDPDTLLDLGRRNVAAGDDATAVDNFRKLLIVQPDHKEGKNELTQAETRIANRRAARLQEEVARARAVDRNRWAQKGRVLEEKKKWEEALEIWQKILKSGGEGATAGIARCRAALYQEAEKLQGSNDIDQARLLFLAADKGGPYKDSDARARALEKLSADRRSALALKKYRAGQEAYMKGDLKTALDLFQAASALDPANRDAQQAFNHLLEERRLRKSPPNSQILKDSRPNHQR